MKNTITQLLLNYSIVTQFYPYNVCENVNMQRWQKISAKSDNSFISWCRKQKLEFYMQANSLFYGCLCYVKETQF